MDQIKKNDRKKIIIVSRSFYPENSPRSFRTTELVKEFARQGHDIVVYITELKLEHNSLEKLHNKVTIKEFGPLKFKSFILKGGSIKNRFIKIIQRICTLLFEYPDIEFVYRLPRILKNEQGYDLLISIAAPHPIHWGVTRAIKKNSKLAKTWIADCGDPYMGVTLETFRKPFYFKYFEKDFCRRANFITVPTEGAIEAYYPEFRSKIKVIPQGFDFNEMNTTEIYVINPVPTFAYAGSLATKGVRNPKLFMEYLKTIDKDFRFHVYSGSNEDILSGYKNVFGEKLVLHDKLDRPTLLEELKKMDFLVNFDNGTSRQLPSKLIDYSMTGRPILNIYPLNPDFDLINQFLKKDYQNKYIINNLERYNIKNVVSEFLNLIKQ